MDFKDFVTEGKLESEIELFFDTAKNRNGYFSDILRKEIANKHFKGDMLAVELDDKVDTAIEKITSELVKKVQQGLKGL